MNDMPINHLDLLNLDSGIYDTENGMINHAAIEKWFGPISHMRRFSTAGRRIY